MTTEVAVLNALAVALAADSAVTIGGPGASKTFRSASKIFALSEDRPVAIMVYGGASLLRVPWETLIAMYRAGPGRGAEFPSVDGYAEAFFQFLQDRQALLFPREAQDLHMALAAAAALALIRERLDEATAAEPSEASTSDRDIAGGLRRVTADALAEVKGADDIAALPRDLADQVRTAHGPQVRDAIEAVFQGHDVPSPQRRRLVDLVVLSMTRQLPFRWHPHSSGIVVAGFGTDDIYPQVRVFRVVGVAADTLIRYQTAASDVSQVGEQGALAVFAQGEMVQRFMEGVDPSYQEGVEGMVAYLVRGWPAEVIAAIPGLRQATKERVLSALAAASDEVLDRMLRGMAEARERLYGGPVTEIVGILPVDELAGLAESLVTFTSFKRRMSWDAETVGGPIDVAVITKGDGLVWIKRKRYFPAGSGHRDQVPRRP
jgi:hypothetical protein